MKNRIEKRSLVLGALVTAIMLATINGAFAIELLSTKNTSTNISKISDSEVNRVWSSNTPACLKDGSKLLGVNKAFIEKRLKYADCSTSEKAREKQRMLGFSVAKIDFTSLSDSMAKQVSGQKVN